MGKQRFKKKDPIAAGRAVTAKRARGGRFGSKAKIGTYFFAYTPSSYTPTEHQKRMGFNATKCGTIYYLYLYREHEQFIDVQILWEKQPNGYKNLREILR
ncbi:MAG: hypothetical protein ACTSRZ_20610 [Promethearchaeota archaeon]